MLRVDPSEFLRSLHPHGSGARGCARTAAPELRGSGCRVRAARARQGPTREIPDLPIAPGQPRRLHRELLPQPVGPGSGTVGGLRGGGGIVGGTTGVGPGEKRVSGVVKSEAPAVDGELDPSIVSKEVRSRLGAIKACYERALKRNPNLSGKIVIHWTITAAGTVSGVDVETDTLGDNEVASCIKSLVARWRFPAPSGGSVEVSFPFVFQASQ